MPSSADLGNMAIGPLEMEGNGTIREEVHDRTMDNWNEQYYDPKRHSAVNFLS
jgi:hypothetical protein